MTSAKTSATKKQSPSGPESFKLEVARNVHKLRSERGLSLLALARLAGISSAMLSQIETGKTTPTIAILWKIATGFGVPFTELLNQSPPHAGVVVKHERPRLALSNADGAFRSTPLLPTRASPDVELYRLVIDRGGRSDSPAHATGTTEVVVVEKGSLTLRVGVQSYELGEGDVASFSADVEHAYVAGEAGAIVYDLVRYGTSHAIQEPSKKPIQSKSPSPKAKPRARPKK